MSRFVCTNSIKNGCDVEVDKIKQFDWEGYRFSETQSSLDRLVFTREPHDIPRSTVATKNKAAHSKSNTDSTQSPVAQRKGSGCTARKRKQIYIKITSQSDNSGKKTRKKGGNIP